MEAVNPDKPNDPEYVFSEERFDQNQDNLEDPFQEGIRLMKEGNLNEAILAFEACVRAEPNRFVEGLFMPFSE